MNKGVDKFRMYSLNMYNVSGIQCGIQSGHANMEYASEYWNDEDFQDWLKNHKTVILLNGGTSNSGNESVYGLPLMKGSMEKHLETLKSMSIKCTPFYEPDMNNSLTSISFLVPDSVYKTRDYGYAAYSEMEENNDFGVYLRKKKYGKNSDNFLRWLDKVGGEDMLWLRLFLKQFRLSSN